MSRISIEVTQEEHNTLKARAALNGKSLKKYMLEKTLYQETTDEAKALDKLKVGK